MAGPTGLGPTQIQSAYKLTGTSGAGRTVALVDAYNDPIAASDLATYRKAYGLPGSRSPRAPETVGMGLNIRPPLLTCPPTLIPTRGLASMTYNSCGSSAYCDYLIELGAVQGLDGWAQVGGTSLSSPLTASVYALAGNTASVVKGSYPYSHTGSLFDVTSGSNGSCSGS